MQALRRRHRAPAWRHRAVRWRGKMRPRPWLGFPCRTPAPNPLRSNAAIGSAVRSAASSARTPWPASPGSGACPATTWCSPCGASPGSTRGCWSAPRRPGPRGPREQERDVRGRRSRAARRGAAGAGAPLRPAAAAPRGGGGGGRGPRDRGGRSRPRPRVRLRRGHPGGHGPPVAGHHVALPGGELPGSPRRGAGARPLRRPRRAVEGAAGARRLRGGLPEGRAARGGHGPGRPGAAVPGPGLPGVHDRVPARGAGRDHDPARATPRCRARSSPGPRESGWASSSGASSPAAPRASRCSACSSAVLARVPEDAGPRCRRARGPARRTSSSSPTDTSRDSPRP